MYRKISLDHEKAHSRILLLLDLVLLEEIYMRDINLASLRSQERSRGSLILIGLLCVVFGSLALVFALFMKPEVQRPQFVGERIRLPITSVEKQEGPRNSGIVREGGMEEKPLGGGILEEEKPIGSEPPEPSVIIEGEGIENKEISILAEKEASEEKSDLPVDEMEGKRPGIGGNEGEKAKVVMVEEPEGLAIPEGKVTPGRYTLNIASFRNKGNADQLIKELGDKGYEAFVEKANIPGKGTWYRVAVGRFSSRGEALAFARGLKEKGVTYSFVRKITEVKK